MRERFTRKNLHGVWCALIVPWTDADELDESRWANEVRSYAGTGVHGVYTGGTTGEFYAQDDDTFERITRICCREAHAVGLPVQIGCSTLSTRTARQRIKVALEHGADIIQIAYPFWLELKPDELLRFMVDIALTAGDTPIVLYHTGRCKRKATPAEIGVLAREVPTFIGMKDTGCDIPTLKSMLAECPELSIFGGDDFYDRVLSGGRGGYCSMTGLNARWVADYYKQCASGRHDEAKQSAAILKRYFDEAVIPMVTRDGLFDSAADRVQRVAGGSDVGLRCAGPYRQATEAQVQQLVEWCRTNAPFLLPK